MMMLYVGLDCMPGIPGDSVRIVGRLGSRREVRVFHSHTDYNE
jgi:hypothetical protein